MAGDWLKMRMDLPEDPAVIAMAASFNVEEDLIVGKLLKAWRWASQQTGMVTLDTLLKASLTATLA